MTVSIRRMSAGTGHRYLLKSVVAGDGNRALSTPLTRYYTEAGTPPGRWLGSGVAALGGGHIQPGMAVSEAQLALLIGMGRDPVGGDQLGLAYPTYKKLADRIEDRVTALDTGLDDEECAAAVARIEAEETAASRKQGVAGYDLTFSVPKSVSVLWGVADVDVQERIVAAHHAAVADVIDLFEREVAATRTGYSDDNGAVAQVGVAGVAAVAYDHYDSRAGDPQLHTHVVVSNKVQTLLDGKWRSLDGRPVFASLVALSAHYNAVLADRLTRDLGVEWEQRGRGADRNPQWEITGVSERLVREFSSRTREIDLAKDQLIAEYRGQHGRLPSTQAIIELRAQATLATRPPKETRSLADLTAGWRHRAQPLISTPAARRTAANGGLDRWAVGLLGRAGLLLTVDDVPLAAVEALAADVIAVVGEKRAVWTHWNLMAEASRQTMDLRFASTADRETVIAMVVDAAQDRSVALTPPELTPSPVRFQRDDGTSVFRPRHSVKYSSRGILDAEARLLRGAEDRSAPAVRPAVAARLLNRAVRLSGEQRAAIQLIATSRRRVDLLVGPAGAGKTTAMRGLRWVWEYEHGPGSVVGLAPSATAAQALADDLAIDCDNTAKWLHDHDNPDDPDRTHGAALSPGQLVIVDEASLAGTVTLERITGIAAACGAKVLLVGDPYQLQSVDAGGAFGLLVERQPHAPALTELHRFTHEWEKKASLALRGGDVAVISNYLDHDRVREGLTDAMLDEAYEAWRADIADGKASILVTESTRAMRALNERAPR